jgi:microcystin-dependent protein
MAINFPDSPTNGQVFTSGTSSWTYDGVKWNLNTNTTTSNDSMPVGSILWFANTTTTPPGWVAADGSAISRTTYATLFATIGTTYGSGDGSTTFNVPSVAATTGKYFIRYTTSVGTVTTTSLATSPVGTMLDWPTTSSYPTGYLRADGTAVSRTSYADLFALIGTTYGTGDGSTTFNLPNLVAAGSGSPVMIIKASLGGTVEPSTVSHAASHIRGGSDIIDADRDQIDFVPTYYTRDSSPAQAGAVTDLTAHLKGIDTLFNAKMSSTALISAHSGIVYGNMAVGVTGSTTKNIGTVTHNFGTSNYIILLTVYTTNAFGDGFAANAQNRTNNSFDIIVSRVGGVGWGDTGLSCSYFVWRW